MPPPNTLYSFLQWLARSISINFCFLPTVGMGTVTSEPVLRIRIRIRRICMFLGFLDQDPDPIVRGMDPDPITKQKY